MESNEMESSQYRSSQHGARPSQTTDISQQTEPDETTTSQLQTEPDETMTSQLQTEPDETTTSQLQTEPDETTTSQLQTEPDETTTSQLQTEPDETMTSQLQTDSNETKSQQEAKTDEAALSPESSEDRNIQTASSMTDTASITSTARSTARSTATSSAAPASSSNDQAGEEQEEEEGHEEEEEREEEVGVDNMCAGEKEGHVQQESDQQPAAEESKPNAWSSTAGRAAPPTSLPLSAPTKKKKVLVAPMLSLSLGGSLVSMDFPDGFLSPSPEDDDPALDLDLDAIETPSDTESLPFPFYDPELEDDLHRLGVATNRRRADGFALDSQSGLGPGTDPTGLGAGDMEDEVDGEGTKWRCFSTGDPPQEGRVNMSVLQPFLRVLSHGGYYGDGMNDIVVFSSCYLPESSMENYQYVMDHLFRFVVGTLDLMVSQNYVIVYLCAGGQKERLPGIGWLRECYTTIARRLRKNLKGFFVVHPTWYIKALITIIKPFISSKFSRKLQFVHSLQELSLLVPTEHVQIPDCVREYDDSLSR